MAQDDWVLFFAEAVKRQRRGPVSAEPGIDSDRDLVCDAHGGARAEGASERRAWNVAVGAYLQRHPGSGVHKAERMVTCLIRPRETWQPDGAQGAEGQAD